MFDFTIQREVDRLRADVVDCAHWLVGYVKDDAPLSSMPENNVRMYRRGDLSPLPYPRKIAETNWSEPGETTTSRSWRSYRERPDYDYYWIIEYDVRFTGHWGQVFRPAAWLERRHSEHHDLGP